MTIKLQGFEEIRNGIYYEYDSDSTPLGEGAMGRVYKGYQVDGKTNSKSPVAIKAIFENIPERIIERARREASVRIDSPYLLKMYSFIEMPFLSVVNGQEIRITRYFIVMELLTGITLYDLVQGHITDNNGVTMPAVKSLHDSYIVDKYSTIQNIMGKVLRGVMALHNANYIHRDIDPSNIMITSQGQIKLIDFGICKPINSLSTADQNLTSTGVFMGKVNYAAPELVIGDVMHQGPATDLYALGVLLFQLCTGHLPFYGDDNDILLAHMRKPIPLKEIDRRPLKNVIAKATQKSQYQRYNSAAQMLSDLESIDFSKRNSQKLKIAVGAVAALAVIIFICIHFDLFNGGKTAGVVVAEEISADERFKSIQTRMWSSDATEVYDAFIELTRMANDARNKDAMFEYGLTFSVGNEFFDIPTHRQKILNLQPDIERANLWLRRSYSADHNSYRAVYWMLNNLIAKKKADASSVLLDEITDLLQKFDEMTADSNDAVVCKYKDALKSQRNELNEWNQ